MDNKRQKQSSREEAAETGAQEAAPRHLANYPKQPASSEEMLDALQRDAFGYFLHETNLANGLVADKTQPDAPASIAAVGFALAAYPVGVERSWMTRAEAVERTLAVLRFFWNSPQGTAPDATGYKGFYYHFLDMKTGRRAGRCELSTVDTGFLLAGMLTAAIYFDQDGEDEREIRTLADALYRRADWQWAQNGGATITHGWKPESGFLKYRWEGYDEALLMYALGLGSPTYPLPKESYPACTSTYQWREIYGHEFLFGSSLFIHQFSHLWIDFRGIQDDFMRDKGIDYFENSRRAMDPVGRCDRLLASSAASSIMSRAACRGRHAAICAGDRPADGSVFQGGVPADHGQVLLQVQLQFDFPARVAGQARLDLAVPLRDQLGAGRIGVREPPIGLALATDAALPLRRHGVATGGIYQRLAVKKRKYENDN